MRALALKLEVAGELTLGELARPLELCFELAKSGARLFGRRLLNAKVRLSLSKLIFKLTWIDPRKRLTAGHAVAVFNVHLLDPSRNLRIDRNLVAGMNNAVQPLLKRQRPQAGLGNFNGGNGPRTPSSITLVGSTARRQEKQEHQRPQAKMAGYRIVGSG